jgi:hypothetical protein
MSVAQRASRRLGAVFAALLLCLPLLSQPASANTRVCRQLEAELASARKGSGGSVLYRKYDRAVAAQSEQIAIARLQAREAGCGFSVLSGRSACGLLNDKIGKMERNLAALQRRRGQLAFGGNTRRDRLRIMAALDANGCRDQRLAARPRQRALGLPDGGTSLFEMLARDDGGAAERATPGLEPSAPREDAEAGIWRTLDRNGHVVISGPGGAFRTVCVRTCDGYFFPLSNASSSMDLDRDQKNCESMCPGTEMQLYLRGAAEESDAMVSVATGAPYTALPNAYLYKAEGTPRAEGCGCNPAKNFSIIAGNPPQTAAPTESIDSGSVVRPNEVSRNRAGAEGELSVESAQGIDKATPQAAPRAMSERKVRVVGPAFLPDPEAAIDLRAPVQKKAR